MNFDEVNQVMDNFIDQSSHQNDEIPASTFFELLFAKSVERTNKTFEIEGRIVDGKIVFILPKAPDANVHVQDNQIVIGEQRIVIKLAS